MRAATGDRRMHAMRDRRGTSAVRHAMSVETALRSCGSFYTYRRHENGRL